MFKFVVSTSHFEEKYYRNIIIGDELSRKVSIDVPIKFLSTLLVKGLENLKINQYRYEYGSDEFNISVKIKKSEKKLDLQLGPTFNYKKEHELFLSLHSESKFRIMLQFEVVFASLCKFDQPSIIVYPGRPLNDSGSGNELNLKGIKLKSIACSPRYSTTDHCIKESIKRIFSSGLFWAVGAAEKRKAKLP